MCYKRAGYYQLLQDTTPVMTKIYSTLGRKFNKKDLEEAQRMGQELVSLVVISKKKNFSGLSCDFEMFSRLVSEIIALVDWQTCYNSITLSF